MHHFCIIVCGHIGAGKTTTARLLGRLLSAPVASVDSLIARIIPQPSNAGVDAIFSSEERAICYATFVVLAEYLLSAGSSVVIDGVFAHKSQRAAMRRLAKKLRVPFFALHCVCPESLIAERTKRRHARGRGVGYRGYLAMKEIYELPEKPFTTIDTSRDIKRQLQAFIRTHGLSPHAS